MLSYLVFPKDSPTWWRVEQRTIRAVERRIPLLLLPALTDDGDEIIIFKSGRMLTDKEFRSLRHSSWARIETQEPYRIMRALNLPAGELGIQPIPVNPRTDT